MKRYSKGSIAFLATVLPLMTASAWAAGDHNHSDASGTVEAPLDIIRPAEDLPAPIGVRPPQTVKVNLDTIEVTGRLADGTAYHYWTFGAKVPGPLVRVRVGDTVEVTLSNAADSSEKHSVDFHASTAPGGGHFATEAAAGESKSFTFEASKPGLYVYHCAVPEAAQHIANGMYGLILVEPEEPLPAVDREFYVMQGEVYTQQAFGTAGLGSFDPARMRSENPEYYVFNGAAGALADEPLEAKLGETIRIYFGVGGPNKTASFHVIGEIFDRVYQLGTVTSPPVTDVQTISVPPGGSAIVDLELEEPGDFTLVDHALARASRGLVGKLLVRE